MGRKTSARRLDIWRTEGFWNATAAVAVVVLCAVAGVADRLDLRLYDAATRISTPAPLAEIAIIGMDDASVAALGPLPWPRDVHARLIDKLAAAGAKTIVYTPSFSAPQSESALHQIRKIKATLASAGDGSPLAAELSRVATEAESALDTDALLASSIQKAGNVFLASSYATSGRPTALPAYARRGTLPDPGAFATPVQSAQHPIAALGSVALGVGHLLAVADLDGAVRQVPLLLRYDEAGIPSLALLAARHSLHLSADDLRIQASPPALRLGGLEIATDAAAMMRTRLYESTEGTSPFATASFVAVLEGKTGASVFKDKVVLVGETGIAAAGPSTQSGGHSVAPVELLAHTVSNMRQGLTVKEAPWITWWAATLTGLLFAAMVVPRLPLMVGLGASLALVLVAVGVEWSLLRYAGTWLPGMLLVAIGLLAGAAAMAVSRSLGHSSSSSQSAETAEADRMMGLALHGQGQLDMAFDRLRKVPPSDALMDNLYHLAQDFERQRNFSKAKAAYEHILRHNRQYKDARARYKRARAKLQKDSEGPSSTPSTLPPEGNRPRLPGDAAGGIPMLGRYQIEKELGKGAMGVVYGGRDPKIGRVVAIKTLALGQEFEGDALIDARARFFREAETAGRLQHPHIVTIFDAGEEHDLAYIAMEFLKGTDLTQVCHKEHLLPVATVLSITARVADALDYAHSHNVVHRDIKPANIMFDGATDAVKVTDFGIARITDSSKTRTGLVLGTPSFMSPEQLAGKKVDGRSDLYSLGVTLFQLLTGTLPLRGESMTELMHKIASVDAPDVRQLRPDVSPAVAKVVAAALKKRPEARYQTGRQFAADLRAAAAEPAGVLAPAEAVVYDADRDATGHKMADFQETVMEPPAVRGAASPPSSGAR
ncbi:MAG: CHASE2 domain-containing protein [Gammaproteobacteria bacterium]|nr:CHASE2 domain-containing protein [Gammaproteobacteria bacterium]